MSGQAIVSLFSGAGGLDMGFHLQGYNILFANDKDASVKPTYDANHQTNLEVGDIRDLTVEDIPYCDGIIGGPPCQSWSLAGNMDGVDDDRGGVFHDYIDIIGAKQPKFFVTENVPGILSKRHYDDFMEIIDRFQSMGYSVTYEKLNAAYYGVPQRRKRVFIVGIRDDLDVEFEFPEGDDEETTQLDYVRGWTPRLSDFPEPVPTEGEANDEDSLPAPNHEYYVGGYSSRFMSRNRVRDWNEPAYTVMANARHQKIHPQAPRMVKVGTDEWKFNEQFEDLYRRYSVREAAFLQTFPEEFEFKYDSVKDGYKMVGNAVPVQMARRIAYELQQRMEL